MSSYITIDGGTTSTRVTLVENKEILDMVKLNIGARASIGNREQYVIEIKNAIEKIIVNNGFSEKKITKILASGMITCEFGLCNLPHTLTPAGLEELHNCMHETHIKEISDIPFVFMRGVKTFSEDIDVVDMMRGEETELMGIMKPEYGNCIYILPGSHSKIIKTDNNGKIVSFSTMLTGEMIEALSQGTILKDAVELSVSEINTQFLLKGYDYAENAGINKALFKVRILKNVFACSKEEIYSFFMGVILCDEIKEIIRDEASTVVIGGKSQIKYAMAEILKNRDDKKIILLSETDVNNSTVYGAIKIYETKSMVEM